MKMKLLIVLFAVIAGEIGITKAQPEIQQQKELQSGSFFSNLLQISDNQPAVDNVAPVEAVEERFLKEKNFDNTSYWTSPFKLFGDIYRFVTGRLSTTTSACMEDFNNTEFFKINKIQITHSQTPISSGPKIIEYEKFTVSPQTEPNVDVCACTIPTDGSANPEAQDICINNEINLVREYGRKDSFFVLRKGSSDNVFKLATFQTTKPYIPPPAQPTAIPPVAPIGSAQAK